MRMKSKTQIASLPTLQTVMMIEKFINDNSGEFKKAELWKKLPRKVSRSTFQIVMSYLEEMNKIIYSQDGIVVYIWNPALAAKYKKRPDLIWSSK